MKKCNKCYIDKTDEEFYKRRKTQLAPYCKDCFNSYCINRWKQRKIDAVNHMGGKCQKCDYSKCMGALEFHHLDPSQKDVVWDKMRLMSWDKVLLELKKCILVCANCHREIHEDKISD